MSGIDFLPFAELPESLVQQVLDNSETIGTNLFHSLSEIKSSKDKFRKQLEDAKLLKRDADLKLPPVPTTCGIDGSFAVERLLSLDLVACAAVSIEGLIPPSEKRLREKPDHQVFISPEKHDAETGTLIRGLMAQMELDLAVSSPHDVVFMDGSLTSRIIHLNQAFHKVRVPPVDQTERAVADRMQELLVNYKTVLESVRTDKQWVSVPKYTSRSEIGARFGWPPAYDDRALMTMLLFAGEYTQPVKLSSDKDQWHLNLPPNISLLYPDEDLDALIDDIQKAMYGLHVIYYRPNSSTPALRIEVPSSIAQNESRIAVVLQALRFQCGSTAIFEPYPLYMADRMVKHLPSALPAFRQTATRKMAELSDGDLTEIFFSTQSYRTD
jgi:hypothetical protein